MNQFETIHPFLDGNGRVGCLLITFLLVHRLVGTRPQLQVRVRRYAAAILVGAAGARW